MTLMKEIESYWGSRAEGYSEYNDSEWTGFQSQAWLKLLKEHLPAPSSKMHILDAGCGPGFFSILLARAGYQMTSIDYTSAMIKKAEENLLRLAPEAKDRVTFIQMDAQDLSFNDETFDAIVSRNVTWNLPAPASAYKAWHRVLKKDGVLLNFDANWYTYLYDKQAKDAYDNDRRNVEKEGLADYYTSTDIDRMERIAMKMPLSRAQRPLWDHDVLNELGFQNVEIYEEISEKVWSYEERVNQSATPLFMIKAVK